MYSQWLNELFERNPKKKKSALAKALGLEAPAISKLLNGTRQVKGHELEIIKSFFGVGTSGTIIIDSNSGLYEYKLNSNSSSQAMRDSSTNKTEKEDWILPESFNATDTAAIAESLDCARVLQVSDNAMAPAFGKGDFVLVNSEDKALPGIFMISDGYSEMVRYCQNLTNEEKDPPRVKISAKAPNFIPQVLEENELQIIGRVVGKINPL